MKGLDLKPGEMNHSNENLVYVLAMQHGLGTVGEL